MRRFIVLFIAVLFVAAIFSPFAAAQKEITFWTTEKEKDRMEAQKKIAQAFTAKTGISVNVVPVEENLLKQKVTAAYAAKSLPDVIFHPIDFTIGWSEEGILNIKAASEVIAKLGTSTFGHGPLNMVRVSQGYAAVPVDGWGQLLLYRTDLFKQKNLAVPDTWDAILAAAKALNDPPRMWGFDAATDPGQTYTQQVFEHIALSNGVRLVDAAGKVNLNTPEMIETLKFYKSLTEYGPPGNIYWLHTRMDYLSDRTAMTIWSPYILDELSGLRRDQPVVPDMAKGQPGFLAKNTGFVTIIKGPRAAAQYGQISYVGISVDANADLAKQWVEYLLTDGYLDWMAMAPEGKMPMRKGTAASPDRFISGWKELEFGATSRAKISEFYGMDTVKSILSGVEGFNRWGFAQGQGVLVSKIYGTKVIPKILKQFLDDEISAEQAAQMMDERVKALQ
jgi:multiple sugar transport system substrate-binding protein